MFFCGELIFFSLITDIRVIKTSFFINSMAITLPKYFLTNCESCGDNFFATNNCYISEVNTFLP